LSRVKSGGVLLLSVLAVACGSDAANRGEAWSVRDSSGVRIVENDLMPEATWRVGTEPLFTVGWEEGGPLFTWPQSGLILEDGGALIGEFSEGKIYRLGSDGSVLETMGRKGEGPGEYQALNAILLKADSVLVSDGRLRRLTILAPDGDVRTARLTGSLRHEVSTILPDGRLLLIPSEGYSALSETRLEWVFQTQPILAMDLEGGTTTTLVELPHLRRWYGDRGGSPGPVQIKGRAGGTREGFAWAGSDRPEVRWYDHSGELLQVARWNEAPASLTSEWRDEMRRIWEEAYRSRGADEAVLSSQLAELEEGLDRHEGPLPYWADLQVDRAGNVWLSRYTPPGQVPEEWRVLGRDGAYMGWLSLPGVISILDISDDRILAVRLDELDVPAVTMFELIKP